MVQPLAEDIVSRPFKKRDLTVGERAVGLGSSLLQGAVDVPKTAVDTARLVGNTVSGKFDQTPIGKPLRQFSESAREAQDIIEGFKPELYKEDVSQPIISRNEKGGIDIQAPNLTQVMDIPARFAPMMLPIAKGGQVITKATERALAGPALKKATGYAAKKASVTSAKKAAPYVGYGASNALVNAPMVYSEAEQLAYQNALQQGYTEEQARQAASQAGIEAAALSTPLSFVTGAAGFGGIAADTAKLPLRVGKGVLREGLSEGFEEGGQQAATQYVQQPITGQPVDPVEVANAAALGAVGGASLGGGFAALETGPVTGAKNAEPAVRAEHTGTNETPSGSTEQGVSPDRQQPTYQDYLNTFAQQQASPDIANLRTEQPVKQGDLTTRGGNVTQRKNIAERALEGELLDREQPLVKAQSVAGQLEAEPINAEYYRQREIENRKLIKDQSNQREQELRQAMTVAKGDAGSEKAIRKELNALAMVKNGAVKNETKVNEALIPLFDKLSGDTSLAKELRKNPAVYEQVINSLKDRQALPAPEGKQVEQQKENQAAQETAVETPRAPEGAGKFETGQQVSAKSGTDAVSGKIIDIREYRGKQFIETDQSNGKRFAADKFELPSNTREFKPTHVSSDGGQLQHLEGNLYVDKEGIEVEDDYATPIEVQSNETQAVNRKNGAVGKGAERRETVQRNVAASDTNAGGEAGLPGDVSSLPGDVSSLPGDVSKSISVVVDTTDLQGDRGVSDTAAPGNQLIEETDATTNIPPATEPQRGNDRAVDAGRGTGVGDNGRILPEQQQPAVSESTGREGAVSGVGELAGQKPAEVKKEIETAAHEAATSPKNNIPQPTDGQKEAGNYKKGHINLQGFDIAIENPKGSERSGVDPGGQKWSVKMAHHYGYIKRSAGADNEQIDVYVGPNPESQKVFVVNQNDPKTGKFDEHKIMLGFNTAEDAKKGYLANYTKGWAGLGSIAELTLDEFKKQVYSGKLDKPIKQSVTADKKVVAQANKLRTVANKLLSNAQEEQSRDRLTNTAKRAREAGSAIETAMRNEAFAKSMLNIADAIERGNAKSLSKVTARTQLELLDDIARKAVLERDRKRSKSYSDEMKYRGRKPERDDLPFVSYPAAMINGSNYLRLKNELIKHRGGKTLASKLPSTLDKETLGKIEKLLGKKDTDYYVGWFPIAQLKRIGQLQRIGIFDEKQLKSAISDYIQFKEAPKQESKAGKLERDLAGQKGVGVDYFPTPKPLAKRMVEMAGIKKGMKVLEPSAGNGNIAEAMRDAGGDVDVAEISSQLREILQAKDFNLVERDFMDYNPGQIYDAIVMNPPFSKNQDSTHIKHAYSLLKPGGQLVSITGEGVHYRQGKTEAAFRLWLEDNNARIEKLPEGTFQDKTLQNTAGVNARLITIDKPTADKWMADENRKTAGAEKKVIDKTQYYKKYDKNKEGIHIEDGKIVLYVDPIFKQMGLPDILITRYVDRFLSPLKENEFVRISRNKKDSLYIEKKTHKGSKDHSIKDSDTAKENFYDKESGEWLPGLSVAKFPEYPANSMYIVKGKQVGVGTDQEPLLDLRTVEIVKKFKTSEEFYDWFNKGIDKKLSSYGLGREDYKKLKIFPKFDLIDKPTADKWMADENRKTAGEDKATAQEKIQDLGEKIGGARKDLSVKTGKKPKKAKSDTGPSWARRFQIMEIVSGDDKGKLAIHDMRSKNWEGHPRQVGKPFNTEEEAKAAIPLIAVSLKHRAIPVKEESGNYIYEIWRTINDRKRVKVVDKQFNSRDDAMRYMAANAQKILETNTTFGEADLPVPDNVMRTGKTRRTGDVVGDAFMDTFGFRGVEFGNWNNQIERQQVMNAAYDGLLDLAEVLNVPPKAIGLNGDLALAFGARGHGLSSAKAHYERSRAVINLTKMNGAGSLAHEFFHALDHYFGRQDGKASNNWIINSDGTKTLKSKDARDYASDGFSYKSQVRPELKAAYKNIMEAIFNKAETYIEDTEQADKFVGRAKQHLAESFDSLRDDLSKQRDPEFYKRYNNPATAEQLADFDTIVKQIINGQFLETEWRMIPGQRGGLSGRWTNDALEKISDIYKAVRGRTGFDSTNRKGALDYIRTEMRFYDQRLKMLADAQKGSEKIKKVPTSFAMNAKELDQGRGASYWTTPHEMAARAFQGYVEDKTKSGNGYSPFLNYAPENSGILTPWGVNFPFPRGEERKAINKAFDQFVSELKTKETDSGVLLYRRKSDLRPTQKPKKRLSVEQVEKALNEFKNDLNLQFNADIGFQVFDTQEQAFGPENSFAKAGPLLGGYDSKSGNVIVIAEHAVDIPDAIKTFRHETIGHYGLNLFDGKVKRRILDSILASQDVPALRKTWDFVNKEYKNNTDDVKAEEVFATIAQDKQLRNINFFDKIVGYIALQLRKMGLIKGKVTRVELHILVEQIAKAIRRGQSRKQTSDVGIRYSVVEQAKQSGYKGNAPQEAEEWLRAKEKGLDMSKEGRMKRAKDMGFDTNTVYYHGSSVGEKITEIRKERLGPFDGIFVSEREGAASSHGDVITEFIVNPDKVLDSFDDINADYSDILNKIKNHFPDATSEQLEDILYPIIIDEKSVWLFDEDEIRNAAGVDDIGEADWMMQNVRGSIGKEYGFDMIAMEDEHGTSYFIPYGSNAKSLDAAFDPDYKESGNILARRKGEIKYRRGETAWDGIRDSEAVGYVKSRLGKASSQVKAESFGLLTLRQIADVAKKVLPEIKNTFIKNIHAMQTEKNTRLSDVGVIGTDWAALPKGVNRVMSDLMHDSTVAGVDGSRPYKPVIDIQEGNKRIKVIYEKMRGRSGENKEWMMQEIKEIRMKIAFEKKRKAIFPEIQARYRQLAKLSPEAARIYNEARDYHEKHFDDVMAALTDRIVSSEASAAVKKSLMAQLRAKFESLQAEAPYFPLARFGEYWVYTRDGDETNFNMFESEYAQKQFIREMERDGVNVLGSGKQLKNLQNIDGVSAEFITQVDDLISQLGDLPVVNDLRDSVYQLYLNSLPDVSARKHFIHRKKTKGFYRDQLRAFAHKALHDANNIAKLKYGYKLQTTLNESKEAIDIASSKVKRGSVERESAWMEEYLSANPSDADIRKKLDDTTDEDEHAKYVQFKKWNKDNSYEEIQHLLDRNKWLLELAENIGPEDKIFAVNSLNELRKSYADIMNPKMHPVSEALNGLGFAWYLGLTPAAAMVNATQTPVVSLPVLAAKVGWGNAAGAMLEATKLFFGKMKATHKNNLPWVEGLSIKDSLKGLEANAYQEWVDSGLIDVTLAHDLAGLSEEGILTNTFKHKLMNVLSFGFHHTERMNREITALASYRSAIRNGMAHDKAVQFASDIVWDSHFDYSAENRARIMRGNVARVVTQFKQYSQNLTYLYGRTFQQAFSENATPQERAEAKRALKGMLSMQFAAAGALGMPMAGVALGIAQGLKDIFGDDDEPEDIEGMLRQGLADIVTNITRSEAAGNKFSLAFSKGLVDAFTPYSISSRLSASDLWIREPNRDLEGTDQAWFWAKTILGPMAGLLLENPAIGINMMQDGHFERGVEYMMPKAIKDGMKAVRFSTEGVENLRGDKLVDDYSVVEGIGQILGFSSSEISNIYDQNNAVKRVESSLNKRRQSLLNDAANAQIEKDTGAYSRAVREIKDFNSKNPAQRITPENILQSVRNRVRRTQQTKHGLYVSKRNRELADQYRFAN